MSDECVYSILWIVLIQHKDPGTWCFDKLLKDSFLSRGLWESGLLGVNGLLLHTLLVCGVCIFHSRQVTGL